MKVILSKSYKDKKGDWHSTGDTVTVTAEEGKRLAEKGGCVEVVTAPPETEPTE